MGLSIELQSGDAKRIIAAVARESVRGTLAQEYEMALIRSFTEKTPERDSRHTEVEATWYVGGDGNTRFLQVDTYGSSTREISGKVSQSIRLDARAASQLRALID